MASFDVDVDDSSPLISYAPAGAWTDSPAGDPLLPSYSANSLHTASTRGAAATITFNGTGISIFGAKKPNYGTYTISVDGNLISNSSAQSDIPSVNQLLGEVKGLSKGQHKAVLTNTGDKTALDIDRVRLQSQVGTSGANVVNSTIDDSDPRIQWGPSESDWFVNTGKAFINSTLHFSSSPSARATMQFSGDAIAIYGTAAPDHADVQVEIDGQNMPIPGGSRTTRGLHPQTLLFFADNLGPQQHNLVISSIPQVNAPYIDIDSITVYSVNEGIAARPSPTSSTLPGGSQTYNSTASTGKSKPSTAIIAGAVVSAIAMVLFLALFFFLIRRRRRRGPGKQPLPGTPSLPMQGPSMNEVSYFTDTSVPGPRQPANVFFAKPTIKREARSGSQTPSSLTGG